MAGSRNAHIPQRGEGQGGFPCGDLLTQRGRIGWVGDAVAVAVEVATVVLAYPKWVFAMGLTEWQCGLEVEGGDGNEKR